MSLPFYINAHNSCAINDTTYAELTQAYASLRPRSGRHY